MKALVWRVAACALLLASRPALAQSTPLKLPRPYLVVVHRTETRFELIAELAPVGISGSSQNSVEYAGLFRTGPAVSHLENQWWILGALTYAVSRNSLATFGAQLLVVDLVGPGGSVAALVDYQGHPGFMVGVQWLAVGLEYQLRWYTRSPTSEVYLKLTIPIFRMTDALTYLRRTN